MMIDEDSATSSSPFLRYRIMKEKYMDQKNHHQCNHGSNGSGFFFGLIVGVVLALLFTTKKGRKMFKEMTDEGMTKFSDFEKKLQETMKKDDIDDEPLDEFDDGDDEEYVKPQERRLPPLPEPIGEVRRIAREVKHEVEKAPAAIRREVREYVEERERPRERREEEPEQERKAAVVHKSSRVRKFFSRKK